MVKDAKRFAEEYKADINLEYPERNPLFAQRMVKKGNMHRL